MRHASNRSFDQLGYEVTGKYKDGKDTTAYRLRQISTQQEIKISKAKMYEMCKENKVKNCTINGNRYIGIGFNMNDLPVIEEDGLQLESSSIRDFRKGITKNVNNMDLDKKDNYEAKLARQLKTAKQLAVLLAKCLKKCGYPIKLYNANGTGGVIMQTQSMHGDIWYLNISGKYASVWVGKHFPNGSEDYYDHTFYIEGNNNEEIMNSIADLATKLIAHLEDASADENALDIAARLNADASKSFETLKRLLMDRYPKEGIEVEVELHDIADDVNPLVQKYKLDGSLGKDVKMRAAEIIRLNDTRALNIFEFNRWDKKYYSGSILCISYELDNNGNIKGYINNGSERDASILFGDLDCSEFEDGMTKLIQCMNHYNTLDNYNMPDLGDNVKGEMTDTWLKSRHKSITLFRDIINRLYDELGIHPINSLFDINTRQQDPIVNQVIQRFKGKEFDTRSENLAKKEKVVAAETVDIEGLHLLNVYTFNIHKGVTCMPYIMNGTELTELTRYPISYGKCEFSEEDNTEIWEGMDKLLNLAIEKSQQLKQNA